MTHVHTAASPLWDRQAWLPAGPRWRAGLCPSMAPLPWPSPPRTERAQPGPWTGPAPEPGPVVVFPQACPRAGVAPLVAGVWPPFRGLWLAHGDPDRRAQSPPLSIAVRGSFARCPCRPQHGLPKASGEQGVHSGSGGLTVGRFIRPSETTLHVCPV